MKNVLAITNLAALALQTSQLTNPLLVSQADSFNGTAKNELIHSGAGSDTLNGGDGNDVLIGGAGADLILGQVGDDVLSGDGQNGANGTSPTGSDTLNGGIGADTLYGGVGGPDFFNISSEAQSLFGYDPVGQKFLGDVIYDFESNVDKLQMLSAGGQIVVHYAANTTYVYTDSNGDGVGGVGEGQVTVAFAQLSGTDMIVPDNISLTFYRTSTGDSLRGSDKADVMAGFAGQDLLIGNGGDSIYVGGDNARDDIRYNAASDSAYVVGDALGAGVDKVFGFVVGEDKLRFDFIDGAKSAQIVAFGGSTFVYVDLGADGSLDMTVIVSGVTGLTQNDLIFSAPAEDQPDAAPPLVQQGSFGDGLLI